MSSGGPDLSVLREGLARIGLDTTDRIMVALQRYLTELRLWNRRMNLVRADDRSLVVRHVLDSAAAVPAIASCLPGGSPPSTIVDVGSGGGFPGIVLALYFPAARVVLLERSARKCAFLSSAAALAGAANVLVANEELSSHRGRYDVVTLRAVGNIAALYHDLAAITAPDGRIVAYKGRYSEAEAEAAELTAKYGRTGESPCVEVLRVDVPFLDAERCLVTVAVPQTSR